MDGIDDVLDIIRPCLRGETVAQINDIALFGGGGIEHRVQCGNEGGGFAGGEVGVEIALNGNLGLKGLRGPCEVGIGKQRQAMEKTL